MIKKILQICVLPAALLTTACNEIPQEAYFNRGSPEELLDVSSETVSVRIESERSIDEVINWVDKDQPTRADLYCLEGDILCAAVEEVLELYGVEYEVISSGDSVLNLMYERVIAHDCENSFIDNSINPYNLSHPVHGCSISSNMVQMVTDKRQFVSPELSGFGDAEKVVRGYADYLEGEPDSQDDEKYTVKGIEN